MISYYLPMTSKPNTMTSPEALQSAPVPNPHARDYTAPELRVLRQFRVVFNAVKSHFRQIEKAAGIGGAQVWALSVIQARPGVGMNELARAMDVHQSTASNLVRALARQQMIVVEKSEADRRAVTLTLLPAGAAVLQRVPGPLAGVLPDAVASLPPEAIASLDAALGQLIVLLKADERAASIPLANL